MQHFIRKSNSIRPERQEKWGAELARQIPAIIENFRPNGIQRLSWWFW
jgi:hypothetical protein